MILPEKVSRSHKGATGALGAAVAKLQVEYDEKYLTPTKSIGEATNTGSPDSQNLSNTLTNSPYTPWSPSGSLGQDLQSR